MDTLDKELLQRLEKLYADSSDKPAIIAQARQLQKYQDKANRFDKMSAHYQQRLRADIEEYIEKYPQDTNGVILLARVLSLGGNDIKSKEKLEEVLQQQPDNLWANLALSTLFFKAENQEEATRCLEDALFYYPGNELAQKRLRALKKNS